MARALASVGSRAWQIQLTVPMGNAADRPALLLQPFELQTLFPLLVWIDETLLAPADILLATGNNVGYFGPYESKLRPGNNPYCIHRAMDHDRRGLRERLVPARAAPGVPFDNGVFAIEVEPVPAGNEAGGDSADGTILGLPREQVLGWRPEQGSIHDPATLTRVLQLGALVRPGLRRRTVERPVG